MGLISSISKGVSKAADFAGNIGNIASAAGSVMNMFGGSVQPQMYSISDMVKDAEKAGIHPVALLQGGFSRIGTPMPLGETFGDRFGQMGQDLQNAQLRAMTNRERKANSILITERARHARLQGDILELQKNDLASKLGRANQTQIGIGVGDTGQVEVVPSRVTSKEPGMPQMNAGEKAFTEFSHTGSGLMPTPSADHKQNIEDSWLPEIITNIRQYLGPLFGDRTQQPPPSKWKKYWPWADGVQWNALKFEWVPYKNKWPSRSEKVLRYFDRLDRRYRDEYGF